MKGLGSYVGVLGLRVFRTLDPMPAQLLDFRVLLHESKDMAYTGSTTTGARLESHDMGFRVARANLFLLRCWFAYLPCP